MNIRLNPPWRVKRQPWTSTDVLDATGRAVAVDVPDDLADVIACAPEMLQMLRDLHGRLVINGPNGTGGPKPYASVAMDRPRCAALAALLNRMEGVEA